MGVKEKLLHIMRLLNDLSDEEHPLSSAELIELLEREGISAERKAIYRDIASLQQFGLDVRKNGGGFYVASRTFKAAELTLMRDAVVSASFISPQKTREMLEKLKTLANVYDAERLERGASIDNPIKSLNEQLFDSIDLIARAIDENRRIYFCYTRQSFDGEFSLRFHEVSPYALAWAQEKYYLIGNVDKYDDTVHFRLDRISEVSLLDKQARDFQQVSPYRDVFDTADYVRRHINMVAGIPQTVRLRCSNRVYNKVVDRFGRSFSFARKGDFFVLSVEVALGEGLLEWLGQFGPDIEVISPDDLRAALLSRYLRAAALYQPAAAHNTETEEHS